MTAERPYHEQLRREQARQLRQIIGVELGPDSKRMNLGDVKPSYQKLYETPYGELAKTMYANFRDQATASGDNDLIYLSMSTGILHGFAVVSRLMRFAPEAYKRYLELSGGEPSVEELGSILENSTDVLKMLAGTSLDRNEIYENILGLSSGDKSEEELPFVISEDESGKPILTVSLSSMQLIEEDIRSAESREEIEKPQAYEKCPALGYVLTTYWRQAIEVCMNEPYFFARDLNLWPAGAQSS